MITKESIRQDEAIRTYIRKADDSMGALGYTEHSFAHVTKVAQFAQDLLLALDYPQRTAELAWIAGYMHDIGNIVNRVDHAQSGAVMAFRILDKLGCDPEELSVIVSAIGNHDESTAFPVNEVAAALILGDKTDVRRSRVRKQADIAVDIHDRVNYAVKSSSLHVDPQNKIIQLRLEVDTSISPVMEYFEIFTKRMQLCRKAAETLGLTFQLKINDLQLV